MSKRFEEVGLAFGQCRAYGLEYWDDPDEQSRGHRRQIVKLSIACGAVVLMGIAIHPSLLMLLALLGPVVMFEVFMLRRSGRRALPQIPVAAQPHERELGVVPGTTRNSAQ